MFDYFLYVVLTGLVGWGVFCSILALRFCFTCSFSRLGSHVAFVDMSNMHSEGRLDRNQDTKGASLLAYFSSHWAGISLGRMGMEILAVGWLAWMGSGYNGYGSGL